MQEIINLIVLFLNNLNHLDSKNHQPNFFLKFNNYQKCTDYISNFEAFPSKRFS